MEPKGKYPSMIALNIQCSSYWKSWSPRILIFEVMPSAYFWMSRAIVHTNGSWAAKMQAPCSLGAGGDGRAPVGAEIEL